MEFEESQAIIGNPINKQKLINRIQEIEEKIFFEMDSEEAIVNLALMNFLLDLKYLQSNKGVLESEIYEDLDSTEEINVISKVVKGNTVDFFLTVLSESLIDYNECITKY